MIAGIGLRLFGDFLDTVFVFGFGWILSVLLKSEFFILGENAFLFGIAISFLYNGILQSSIGDGQSFAYKILGIQVLTLDGECVSFLKSLLRYSVLAVIVFDNYIKTAIFWIFPYSLSLSLFATCLVDIVILGYVLLLIINPLRRGLQDLMVGTVVIKKGTFDKGAIKSLNDSKRVSIAYFSWTITSVFLILFFGTTVYMYPNGSNDEIRDAVGVQGELMIGKIIQNARCWNKTVKLNGSEKIKCLYVDGSLNKFQFDDEVFREKQFQILLRQVIAASKRLNEIDRIRIIIHTGFDIGIGSLDNFKREDFTADGKKIEEEVGNGQIF